MKDRIVTVSLLTALALTVIIMMRLFASDSGEPEVILMPPVAVGIGTQNDDDTIVRAEINRENVLNVISTLERADNNYRRVLLRRLSGGSQYALTEYQVWESAGRYRVSESRRGVPVKNFLVLESEFWIWYDDSGAVFHREGTTFSEADPFLGLLTYEDVFDIPDEDIISVGISDLFLDCIHVVYRGGSFGYVTHLYVSQSTGLLIASETYDGDTLIFDMVCDFPTIGTQNDDIFSPPR